MRILAVSLFIVSAAPAFAADKDDDKAKQVATAFLKGLKEKDLDAMMKVADVPSIADIGPNPKTIEKREELKEAMAKLIETAKPEKVMALEVGKGYDMAGLAKYAKDNGGGEETEKFIARAEKFVGKDGRMVMLVRRNGKEGMGFLIRFRDGKALIASVPE